MLKYNLKYSITTTVEEVLGFSNALIALARVSSGSVVELSVLQSRNCNLRVYVHVLN
jgi:hypothetical protein